MKTVLLACAVASAATTMGCDKLKSAATQAGLTFGGDFEGEITMNATRAQGAASGPTQLVVGIKKPKYRVDATGTVATDNPMMAGGATLLLDPPQKKGWALMPSQKKAVVLDFDKMKASRVPGMGGGGTKSNEPPPKIEKTGKKETVAGYECEIWYVTTANGQKSEICAADGITWIDLGDLGWSSPEMTVAAVATGANRFPLRVVSNGVKLEATRIEKKKLDDARFVVPPDYQVIDIGNMIQNLPFQLPQK